MNTREKVLKEALECVNGEREKQYGNPEDNFQRIADFWGLYLTTLFEGTNVVIELDPKDVAVMMVLFKIARSLGDEDKLDNYVDIIGYAACGAEIFEEEAKRVCDLKKEIDAKLDEANDSYQYFMEKNFGKGAVAESRSCSKKASDNIRDFFERVAPGIYSDPYSDYHDELAHYVSIKAKEKHIPLDNLKSINRKFPRELEELLDHEATDCAINGKKLIDCYKKIDELFDKYDIPDKSEDKDVKDIRMGILTGGSISHSYWKVYDKVASYITAASKKANISQFDVVDYLVRNGHAPTEMAALLLDGRLNSNTVDQYIDDAIDELNTFHDDKKESK